jgi:hypothetical protein
MDIYDGAAWTEMDIEDLKGLDSQPATRSRKRPNFYAAPIASMTSRANAKSWA